MAGISKTHYTSQNIDNMSFDESLGVSMVEIIGADGVLKNPATETTIQDLDNKLSFIGAQLEYGLITDSAKRLKVVPEQATAANLLATVSIAATQTLATVTTVGTVNTVASVTNTARQGDLQMQRVNEAILDAAFINGITNNLSF